MLHDTLGRTIRYLRLSLTEACPMRCSYCRPEVHASPDERNAISPLEIERLVRHLVTRHGLRKVRLTGGEPTSRPDLIEIITRLASIPDLADLAMTTNGLSLAARAASYAHAGLRRVNVSLDTLDPDRFRLITGVDGLERVLAGLDAAGAAGLSPIRLNTVVVRGANEQDLAGLLRFAAHRGHDIRFIELMPMGPLARDWEQRFVPQAQMRALLDEVVVDWQAIPQGHDAARSYRVRLDDGALATVGFITPMSCDFCAACDRIRITSSGLLYPCLMDQPGPGLLPALRPVFDPDAFDRLLSTGLTAKRAQHPVQGPSMMIQLGG